MATDTSAKFFHSGMPGAPSLIGAPGSLISVLDACIVDGFAPNSIDSITIANGVGTIARSAGMPYEIDVVLQISGATYPTALNGERRISSISTYAATFDASDLPDCVATGVLSVKIAPAGWNKLFSGANLAVYQSADPKSTKCCLRVDDTGTSDARVVGYEAMSDLNTGAGRTPLDTQIAGGGYWPKADSLDNPPREWAVFSDGRILYLWTSPFDNRGYQGRRITGHVFCFGDLLPHIPNNPYAWVLAAGNQPDTYFSAYTCSTAWLCSSDGHFTPRNAVGAGASSALVRNARTKWDVLSQGRIAGSSGLAYPSPSMSALLVTDLWADTYTDNDPVGFFPGIKIPMQAVGGAFGVNWQKTRVGDRTLMAIYTSTSYSQIGGGNVFFDITGPWR